MKKIVFVTIPIQPIEGEGWDPEGYIYTFNENKKCEYNNKVHFAVNGFLAKTLNKDDDVTIIQILVNSSKSKAVRNAEIQQTELDKLNKDIEAVIHYQSITTEFNDTGKTIEKRFRELIGVLQEDSQIITDMTYGTKTLIPVLFYVLGFAEKFFNADIKNILYDKIEFDHGYPVPGTCELYDVTSLYYLNSLTSIMKAPDGKTALERLDKFFAL